MSYALIDTRGLLDHRRSDQRARKMPDACPQRSISIVSWLELVAPGPPDVAEPARGFLRTFERLSICEGLAGEALRPVQRKPGLPMARALTGAIAKVNPLHHLTSDPAHVDTQADRCVRLVCRGEMPRRMTATTASNLQQATMCKSTGSDRRRRHGSAGRQRSQMAVAGRTSLVRWTACPCLQLAPLDRS